MNCPVCGDELVRHAGEKPHRFARRRYCGRRCSQTANGNSGRHVVEQLGKARTTKVAELAKRGFNLRSIARELCISEGTARSHLVRAGIAPPPNRLKRLVDFDWDAIQAFYDEGRLQRECLFEYQIPRGLWYRASHAGLLQLRPTYREEDGRVALRRAIRTGSARCSRCGIKEWLGKPLTLDIHHINGNNQDQQAINLEIVCPNCHRQTPNWGKKTRT